MKRKVITTHTYECEISVLGQKRGTVSRNAIFDIYRDRTGQNPEVSKKVSQRYTVYENMKEMVEHTEQPNSQYDYDDNDDDDSYTYYYRTEWSVRQDYAELDFA